MRTLHIAQFGNSQRRFSYDCLTDLKKVQFKTVSKCMLNRLKGNSTLVQIYFR